MLILPATDEPSTYSSQAATRRNDPREPRAEIEGSDASWRESQERIESIVHQICDTQIQTANSRWKRRVAFVRPAVVSFSRPRSDSGNEISRADAMCDVNWDVVTTDLSPVGAGILSYSHDEPLSGRVTLCVDGAAFECEIRWTNKIGRRVYRYGLLFLAVNDATPARLPVSRSVVH